MMGPRMGARPRVAWPEGAQCAVTLSFDVDAESSQLGRGEQAARRLTSLSHGRYGVVRGLPRLLDLLEFHGVPATFFVPGYTAETHPQAIKEILLSGHEVGHHGYLHERPDTLAPEEELTVARQGLAALVETVGVRPSGYRAPGWEITPTTLEVLADLGFLYDSSCMGDDVPYVERAGEYSILELPVHWLLDDWPHFGFSGERGGRIAPAEDVFGVWSEEFDGLYEEGGYFMLTMHPEVSGRPYRAALLDRLIRHIKGFPGVWWATADQVARHCAPLMGATQDGVQQDLQERLERDSAVPGGEVEHAAAQIEPGAAWVERLNTDEAVG